MATEQDNGDRPASPALRPEGPQQELNLGAIKSSIEEHSTSTILALIAEIERLRAALSASRTAPAPPQEGLDLASLPEDAYERVEDSSATYARIDQDWLDLAPIKARERKAIEGPWAWESVAEKSNDWVVGIACAEGGAAILGHIDPPDDCAMVDTVIRHQEIGANESSAATLADAAFIAHARTDIPALITEVERHRARIQVLETSVDYLRYLVDHPVTNPIPAPAEGEALQRQEK